MSFWLRIASYDIVVNEMWKFLDDKSVMQAMSTNKITYTINTKDYNIKSMIRLDMAHKMYQKHSRHPILRRIHISARHVGKDYDHKSLDIPQTTTHILFENGSWCDRSWTDDDVVILQLPPSTRELDVVGQERLCLPNSSLNKITMRYNPRTGRHYNETWNVPLHYIFVNGIPPTVTQLSLGFSGVYDIPPHLVDNQIPRNVLWMDNNDDIKHAQSTIIIQLNTLLSVLPDPFNKSLSIPSTSILMEILNNLQHLLSLDPLVDDQIRVVFNALRDLFLQESGRRVFIARKTLKTMRFLLYRYHLQRELHPAHNRYTESYFQDDIDRICNDSSTSLIRTRDWFAPFFIRCAQLKTKELTDELILLTSCYMPKSVSPKLFFRHDVIELARIYPAHFARMVSGMDDYDYDQMISFCEEVFTWTMQNKLDGDLMQLFLAINNQVIHHHHRYSILRPHLTCTNETIQQYVTTFVHDNGAKRHLWTLQLRSQIMKHEDFYDRHEYPLTNITYDYFYESQAQMRRKRMRRTPIYPGRR